MDSDNETQLVAELRVDEGVRYYPYRDTKGVLTVGVGHNLQSSPLIYALYPLTDAQIDALLETDLQAVFDALDRTLPWWIDMDDVRQRVIANMCFNLGINRLMGFRRALTAMRQGRYGDAADEMLDSDWAKQVGVGTEDNPGRALRLANMMRYGK